ncbi:MAG TPA: filamentous hemagglutinin N-terminal domain-containing protein [Vicinamibacterales bacterium]|nr:filamentous hemagglutinin N-terminal domain-containing protein [Vicinamibacterales bacterium]
MKKPSSVTFFSHFRRAPRGVKACIAVLLSMGTASTGLQAQGPTGGSVRAGDARITGEGTARTQIDQLSDRAIIDWRSFGIGADGQVVFVQPSAQSATLNRVTGAQVSVILGQLDANGQVLLINPNGVVFGGGSQVNVGSLIATTSNISDANFLAGRLIFDQPGRPGAGILNAGALTARDGGLVALVAPHVRNDGLIAARLGKVVLGSADTFTVDLYGDALINLALSGANAGQLAGPDGRPVTSLLTNSGRIDTDGGQTVLMTARGAKSVLDSLINMSGTIKADTVVQQGGKILLLAEGGKVDVTGTLSAAGPAGGSIQVLGDQVHLGASAALDASGAAGGGTIQVGGAYQGSGDTYRAQATTVDAGATLQANATDAGHGGQVVVWSDGTTHFAGAVEARGGASAGNGGQLEVSGKGTLDFRGQADASAANGTAGSLLLDPAVMTIGAEEASTLTRVLRTGTTANLQADVDINVNSAIFGGDREQGGGLNMTAGNNIKVNDFIVTNNGAVNMTATQGTVTIADGKAVFAGSAPISVSAGGNLFTGPMLTSNSLSIRSVAGSVAVNSFIDDHTGPVSITAAGTVDINQPIINIANGSQLTIAAGQDVNVNGQVDGRGGVAGGAVSITAARDLTVNQAVVTNNGKVALLATNGAMNIAAATPLVSGAAAMTLAARTDISTGAINAGTLAINATAGTVNVNGIIDSATGATTIAAGTDVNINQAVLNGQTGSALGVSAGRDVNVNAVIDGRGGAAGGTVSLNAARNLGVNDYVVTNNGALGLTAGGALAVSGAKGTFAGNAAITMRAGGNLSTGAVSGGSLAATSTGGGVTVNGIIDGNTGRVDLTAAGDVTINQAVLNARTGNAFNATAGRDVVVNGVVDGRGGATGGTVTLKANRDAAINNSIVTNNATIGISAASGAATMAAGTALVSGNQAITIDAAGDVTTRGISGGSLSATSRNGSVMVEGVIDGGTGRVDLSAGRDVNIDAPVLNTRTGASLNAAAGQNVNVNAQIDGSVGASGGAVNLTASQNVNVNAAIATHDGAIRLSAINGATTVANTAGLFAGTAAINVDALGNIQTGILSGGVMNVTSRGGGVAVTGQVAGNGGAMTIGAAGQVDINSAVTNPGTSSPLSITAGTDINVNAAVGRTAAGTPSSAVTLLAGQNVNLNQSIVTENAAIGVTATNGTVTTASSEGLFAGNGNVTVEAGQDLSTPDVTTTGTLALRSTGGSVNVDKAINGTTGAVTIEAANDVNVNQGIANPQTASALSVSAGNDINVNAVIDGRDDVLTGPSGTITLLAANDINVNDDVIGVDTPVTLTATGGTVNWATGKALFAGTGAISVTAGSDLDTGSTSTTGALNFTSTGGSVNVNTAIDDTTGDVTITAGNTVNVNQEITNLKSGADLVVNAGTDINVSALVDGRSGAVAGGTVTMTAANDLNLIEAIATNNGVVNLTATAGSVTVPVGTEVLGTFNDPALGTLDVITTPMKAIVDAGSAAVNITSGDNFTLASPIKTTGALTITSTNGDITTNAPIADQTGVTTLTAGDALIVNREIRTNNAAITLNAGAGGITINSINDYDYSLTSSVNSGTANLSLNSVGNVAILDSRGISSSATVSIDTRSQILSGSIGNSTYTPTLKRPQQVTLNADGGIVAFSTGRVGRVDATSSGGSINLTVDNPNIVNVTTGTPNTLDCPTCNITLSSNGVGSYIGNVVTLNAGGTINLPGFRTTTLNLTARSGDINLQSHAEISNSFVGTAGRDVLINGLLWMGGAPNAYNTGGPLTLTAGRDIIAASVNAPIHISNSQTVTMTANRNLALFILETLGAVNLTATTGNITLNKDLGPHITNNTSWPDFNPSDKGVASLTMSAGGNITMQGARAEGDVSITSGGNLSAAKAITSVNGSVTLSTGGTQSLNQAVPIGTEEQVDYPGIIAPAVPPGPKPPLPSVPGAASNGGPGLPAFAEIPVSFADQIVGGVGAPGAASGAVGLAAGSGGTSAPGGRTGFTGRPGQASGAGPGQASGSSDPGTADTAAALRAAGQSCGEESSGDTGLAAVEQKDTTNASEQKKASCAPVAAADQAAADAPEDPTGSTPAATPPIGGVNQQ